MAVLAAAGLKMEVVADVRRVLPKSKGARVCDPQQGVKGKTCEEIPSTLQSGTLLRFTEPRAIL